MAALTIEETKAFVEKLVASGNGDHGRLNHILSTLKQGRNLYKSDQKYLDGKLAQEIGLAVKITVDENVVTKVKNLIATGKGDMGRLQFILESLKQGKTLYKSDQKYLDSKLGEKIDYSGLTKDKDSVKTIEDLKSQIKQANEKIANLESILNGKVAQLGTLQASESQKPVLRQQGAMPKGWQRTTSDDIHKIRQQISIEQTKLDKEKTEAEQLKIEQSKLMQIILNRKEFERQVKIEKEQLEKQIEQELRAAEQQSVLVTQIKAKEMEIAQAKKDRDIMIKELEQKQARLTDVISAEKETLSEIKNQYEKISSEIKRQELEMARQVEQERLRLAEQAKIAQKLKTEKAQLDAIKEEHEKIMLAAKSQELDLEAQLKKENEGLEQQENLLKKISIYEKHLANSKQKRALLASKIEEQKKALLETSPVISQINNDQDLLGKIVEERTLLEKQIKLAEYEMKGIKKEKASLEKQIKAQKSSIAGTKKKEITKIRQLKQKKKILANEMQTEAGKIRKFAKDLN